MNLQIYYPETPFKIASLCANLHQAIECIKGGFTWRFYLQAPVAFYLSVSEMFSKNNLFITTRAATKPGNMPTLVRNTANYCKSTIDLIGFINECWHSRLSETGDPLRPAMLLSRQHPFQSLGVINTKTARRVKLPRLEHIIARTVKPKERRERFFSSLKRGVSALNSR